MNCMIRKDDGISSSFCFAVIHILGPMKKVTRVYLAIILRMFSHKSAYVWSKFCVCLATFSGGGKRETSDKLWDFRH